MVAVLGLVSVVSVVSVVSAVYPPARHRIELLVEVIPAFAPQVASGATTAVGLLMLSLSRGLRRRKRQAWQVAVVASAALVILHLVKGLDVEEATLLAAVLTLLAVARPAFSGAPDPRSSRHVSAMLAVSVTVATIAGCATMPHRLDSLRSNGLAAGTASDLLVRP